MPTTSTMRRRLLAFGGLSLVVIGLLLTAFGTQYYTTIGPATSFCHVFCITEAPLITTTDFTLNYIGGLMAILGAVVFGVANPTNRFGSDIPRILS